MPSLAHDPGNLGASDTTPLFLMSLALLSPGDGRAGVPGRTRPPRRWSGWTTAAARAGSLSTSSRRPTGVMSCGCPATGCTSTPWSIPICGCLQSTRRPSCCTSVCTASPSRRRARSRADCRVCSCPTSPILRSGASRSTAATASTCWATAWRSCRVWRRRAWPRK